MTETSPREEGDDGHNNQLSAKVVAAVRTVMAIYGRKCEVDGSGVQDGRQRQDQDGWRQRQWATGGAMGGGQAKLTRWANRRQWEATQDGQQR